MKYSAVILAIVAVYSVGGSIHADNPTATTTPTGVEATALPVVVKDFEGVQGGVFRDGRLFIGGQPSEGALQRFHDLGVTAIVNLRTPAEMDDRDRVPFDEAAAVAALGMDYIHIPLGGDDHPYDKAAVAAFASVLAEHEGPVFLHCTVAWRASYLWAAYLILYQNFSLDDALAHGEAIAISPPPLEGLLGRPLKLEYAN